MRRKTNFKSINELIEHSPSSNKGLHSEIHVLAKDISEYCQEPKKFALYLGVIKRIGFDKAYQIFSGIKQSRNVKTPGKLFLFLSSTKNNKNVKN